MLDSTIELISLAASNSLAVFCFCNLIIAILLVGSSKPRSDFDEVKSNGFPTINVNYGNFKKNTVLKANGLIETEEEKVSSVSIDMVDNTDETPDEEREEEEEEEEEEEDDDDELRKRVEEFIEKINRGWRAEKLKTYTLGK